MALFIGVDPGTIKMAVALFKDGRLVGTHLFAENPKEVMVERIPSLAAQFSNWLADVVSTGELTVIGFEDAYVGSRNLRVAIQLAQAVGFLKAIAWIHGVDASFIFDVPVRKARKALCGRGAATKADVLEAAQKLALMDGYDCELSQDEADAIAVAYCLWTQLAPFIREGKRCSLCF